MILLSKFYRSDMSFLGMRKWWDKVRGNPTEQEKAQNQVEQAQKDITDVRDRVVGEAEALKRDQIMLRAELQNAVNSRAPQAILMDLTKKLAQLDNQILEKNKLLANIHRETTQLQDANTIRKWRQPICKAWTHKSNWRY